VEQAGQPVRPGLDPGSVGGQSPPLRGWVIHRQDLPDLVERQLQVAQTGDRPGGLELLATVAAVAVKRSMSAGRRRSSSA